MSIVYFIDQKQHTTFVVWHGTVTSDEWNQNLRQLLHDPAWVPVPNAIVDLRTATDTSAIDDDAIAVAVSILAQNRSILPGRKVAAIARDEFSRALKIARAVSQFGISLLVFQSTEVACTFAGVELQAALQQFDRLRAQVNT